MDRLFEEFVAVMLEILLLAGVCGILIKVLEFIWGLPL